MGSLREMAKWDEEKVRAIQKFLIDDNQRSHPYHIPWKGDKLVTFDVYKVPTRLLSFNFNNTRIRADLESYLFASGKKIDKNNKKQRNEVQKILLQSEFIGEEQTRILRADLRKRGQLDPSAATLDGTLIDGNRRLAIFRKLVSELGINRFTEMDICILPEDATQNDLKELEMRIQMSRTYRVNYSRINTALEFRNLHENLGWKLDKIENVTGGQYKSAHIERAIRVIDLIDEYLHELSPRGDHVKQYGLAESKYESFDNLYGYLKWSKENSPSKTKVRKRLGFQIIAHKDSTYTDIRKYGGILKDKGLERQLVNSSATLKDKNPTSYMSEMNIEKEWESFQKSKGSYKESRLEPKKIAEQAYKKLLTLEPKRIKRRDPKLMEILNKILKIVNELKKQMRY